MGSGDEAERTPARTRSLEGSSRSVPDAAELGAASTEAPVPEPEPELVPGDRLLEPGSRAGEYVIERVLGAGGFGTVYEAVQPVIRKRVAIKILAARYSFDPSGVARFAAEARVTNEVGHPNIVGVFSFGRLDDGRH
jgi:eukaryotic-like serine/threonine-protein kinase